MLNVVENTRKPSLTQVSSTTLATLLADRVFQQTVACLQFPTFSAAMPLLVLPTSINNTYRKFGTCHPVIWNSALWFSPSNST